VEGLIGARRVAGFVDGWTGRGGFVEFGIAGFVGFAVVVVLVAGFDCVVRIAVSRGVARVAVACVSQL
jgi:hypothetical protein